MVVNILNIPDQHAGSGCGNNQQRSDGRWEDPLRAMTVFNLVLPKVTLRLSDRVSLFFRKSGVTMRIILRFPITGRRL